jgi:hypothetical protein
MPEHCLLLPVQLLVEAHHLAWCCILTKMSLHHDGNTQAHDWPQYTQTTRIRLCPIVCRFADLMDLSKDRSRLDFFLRKAKTAPSTLPVPVPPGPLEDCPSLPCKPAAATGGEHAEPAASGQEAPAAHRMRSAPAELAADAALSRPPGGPCLQSECEAERSCGEAEDDCGSEACSERGEDADEGGDAAIDLISPEKGGAPEDEWREHCSGGNKWHEGYRRESKDVLGSRAELAQRAAEMVHLGLDSPPQVCSAAKAPSAGVTALLHSCAADVDRASRSGHFESAARADASLLQGEGVGVGGRGFQCAWPQQAKSDSADDSWSSDSWSSRAGPAARPSRQDCPDVKGQLHQCDRMQPAECPDDDWGGEGFGLRPEQLQSVHAEAAAEEHWKCERESMPGSAVCVKAEEPQSQGVHIRPDAREERDHSSKGDENQALPKEATVDLSAVDVAEQERILRMIELQRRARPRASGSEQGVVRKRGQGLATGGSGVALVHGAVLGSQTKRRQLSIGAFILKAPSSKQ